MKTNNFKFVIYTLTAVFCLAVLLPHQANAQRRDFFTDEEVELVRDAQEIDLRVGVLTKAIERRLLVVGNDPSQIKKAEKDVERWGELPKGSRGLLLWDVERILQKAIDDIDDTAAHTKTDEKLFPKAMSVLTKSCQEYIPRFRTLYDSAADEKEKSSLTGSIENCNLIIEASAKVPKAEPRDKKKKSKKNSDKDSN